MAWAMAPALMRETGLQIVGAEHDDQDIDRHVGLADGREMGKAVLVAADRIVEHRRSAVEAFLDHVKFVAEFIFAGAVSSGHRGRSGCVHPV